MNDHSRRVASTDHEVDPVALARDRIVYLLDHDDELHLGMAIFDLWAAFDELVDPLHPPIIGHVWAEDPAQAMRDAHTELVTAIEGANSQSAALAIGRAAGNVANALDSFEHSR